MANCPQELAQDAGCPNHTDHMTGLWFLPTRLLRLNTNEWTKDPGNRSPAVTSITHRSPCIKRGEYSSVSGVNTKGWKDVVSCFWQAKCLYNCHTDEIFTAVCINNRFIKTPKMSVSAGFVSVITNPADYSEENIEWKLFPPTTVQTTHGLLLSPTLPNHIMKWDILTGNWSN